MLHIKVLEQNNMPFSTSDSSKIPVHSDLEEVSHKLPQALYSLPWKGLLNTQMGQ